MACASFLKFHPTLTKEMSKFAKVAKQQDKARVRHSTYSSKDYKDYKMTDNINLNLNESRMQFTESTRKDNENDSVFLDKKSPLKFVMEKQQSEGSSVLLGHISSATSDQPDEGEEEMQLPLTLQHLVYFWEELSMAVLRVINQELILPSPAITLMPKATDKKEKEKDRDKKAKKKREFKPVARDNPFGNGGLGFFGGGVAGAAGAGGAREGVCELCDGMFPHPVTYHMRQSHPGCGHHASGKGYNSGGHFCGGWAGNCGEGGVGGSSWYLICDKCRDKYLKEKRQAVKEKEKLKKAKKKTVPARQPSVVSSVEPHIILRNNAMFLLDLASATGLSLPTHTHKKHQQQSNRGDVPLPSVTENVGLDLNPFPPVPFQYLIHAGAQGSDTAFADDFLIDSEDRVFVRSSSISVNPQMAYRPRLHTEPRHCPLARTGSLGQDIRTSMHISPPSPQVSSHMLL